MFYRTLFSLNLCMTTVFPLLSLKKLDDVNCCNEDRCKILKKTKVKRKAWRKRKDDRWDMKLRRVGRKRRRDKKEDLEIKASEWQDGRNVLSPTHPPLILHPLQLCRGCSQHAQQSRGYSKYTPTPSTTPPIASLFSHRFSSHHSKCYSQLVKVHYTLSSWPEIYTPQCLCRSGEEGCNPLRLMTVHVSWWKWWILWFLSMWIYIIRYYCTELTWNSCNL